MKHFEKTWFNFLKGQGWTSRGLKWVKWSAENLSWDWANCRIRFTLLILLQWYILRVFPFSRFSMKKISTFLFFLSHCGFPHQLFVLSFSASLWLFLASFISHEKKHVAPMFAIIRKNWINLSRKIPVLFLLQRYKNY